jgi:hypothetical protein
VSRLHDPNEVAAQYARSDNFDARVRLYQLYSRARPSWLEWLFERIDFPPQARLLEVGTGTGRIACLQEHVAREIETMGSFHLTVSAGVCEARR